VTTTVATGPGAPGADVPPAEVGRIPATLPAAQREIERLRMDIKLLERQDYHVLDLTDEQFEQALKADKLRQERAAKIVRNRLEEDVHYGIPKDRQGRAVAGIRKPFLYQAGAEKLREIYRYSVRQVEPAQVTADKDYVAVTVVVGVFDTFGRLLATRAGACNSREKRFQARDGGWIYRDAREVLHGCLTMAEKRASVLATREATGTSGLFANPEELEQAAEEAEHGDPWTEAEKTEVYKAAHRAGITTEAAFAAFVETTLGRRFIGTGGDVQALLAALSKAAS
jgi:hypothetical protein